MRKAAVKRKAVASAEEAIAEDAPLEYRPEDRMGINVWIAGILYPCALIYYGWITNEGLYWLVPMVGAVFFGFGSMLVFGAATTMLTEFVPGRSSSAVAVNNCRFLYFSNQRIHSSTKIYPVVRNICSCIGGIVAEPLIVAIGNGWLFTILGIAGLVSISIIWVMRKVRHQFFNLSTATNSFLALVWSEMEI